MKTAKPKYFIINKGITLPLLISFTSILFLNACSQYKNNILSKSYHNLTARYNAYFLAREKMKEVDLEIWKAHKEDYNKPLSIFPYLDTILQKSLVPSTDEVIKKASLPVQKHKNSNWVDDSYILIGKSRVYRGEYPLAIETFKYVNTKSKDKDAKHAALIWLVRTFLLTEDKHSIPVVLEYLKKGTLSNKNKKDYHLTLGHLNQLQEENFKVIEHLEASVPYLDKRDTKSRVHFILGQLYQLADKKPEAYKHYRQVLKHSPPYELSFFTKLYIAQVSELSGSGDIKKIDKYFKKLLKDKKNIEYRDKIYYEIALFKLKQNDVKKSISNFEKSIEASSGNNFQKARSYWELGKIYYDRQQNYEMAKLYYDSTITLWDKKDKDYKLIAQRQEVLKDFVDQLHTIQREDSLQKLAVMDSVSLSVHLDKIILDNERKQREEMKRMELAAKNKKAANATGPATAMGNNQTWYFYNPTAITMGRMEFEKKWGARRLEDNWRRSVKEIVFEDEDEMAAKESKEKEIKVDSVALRAGIKQNMYKDIPLTKAMMDTSNHRMEQAYYKLGKIYDLNLHEKENSINTFEKLLSRFPQTEHKPEVLYFLYLLLKEKDLQKAEAYKQSIYDEYASSLYAKILKNPNNLKDSKALNAKVAQLYKEAFYLYEKKDYFNAENALSEIKQSYPENDIEDKIEFLNILIQGKTKNSLYFKNLLDTFIDTYNNSTLLPKAQELLAVTETYIAKRNSGGTNNLANEVKYIYNLAKPHYFMAVFPNEKVNSKKIIQQFETFNQKLFANQSTESVFLNINDSTSAVVIKEFKGKKEGLDYTDDITSVHSFLNDYKPYYKTYLISSDNYLLLEESKQITAYEKFYEILYKE